MDGGWLKRYVVVGGGRVRRLIGLTVTRMSGLVDNEF